MTDGRRVAAPARVLRSYVVPGNALEFGASLGNAHCWLTTHGNGSIQDFFSTDIGQTIANTIAIRYGGIGYHLLDAGADATTLTADTTTRYGSVRLGISVAHSAAIWWRGISPI